VKLSDILEKMGAEAYQLGKSQMIRIKYLTPTQEMVKMAAPLNQFDRLIQKYPQLKTHLGLVKKYISSLDPNTLAQNITAPPAGWDIEISGNVITLRSDNGKIIKTLRV